MRRWLPKIGWRQKNWRKEDKLRVIQEVKGRDLVCPLRAVCGGWAWMLSPGQVLMGPSMAGNLASKGGSSHRASESVCQTEMAGGGAGGPGALTSIGSRVSEAGFRIPEGGFCSPYIDLLWKVRCLQELKSMLIQEINCVHKSPHLRGNCCFI